MTVLSVAQLAAAGGWSQLCLLLVLTAAPTVFVAVHRPEDRPVAVPTALGCLAGAALLALPDGLLSPVATAVLLTALYGVAMAVGAALEPRTGHATAGAAGRACSRRSSCSRPSGGRARCSECWRSRACARSAGPGGSGGAARDEEGGAVPVAWRAGAAQLVLGARSGASADLAAVEWYRCPPRPAC